jgi:chaperonin cofactor prefoldin
MNANIINQGERLDKLREKIAAVIEACKKKERRLTRQGCTEGHYYYKGVNKDIMFVLGFPDENHNRKYTHIGQDVDEQDAVIKSVERYAQRKALNGAREDLEKQLKDLDWQIRSLSSVYEHVEEYARLIHEKHVKGK